MRPRCPLRTCSLVSVLLFRSCNGFQLSTNEKSLMSPQGGSELNAPAGDLNSSTSTLTAGNTTVGRSGPKSPRDRDGQKKKMTWKDSISNGLANATKDNHSWYEDNPAGEVMVITFTFDWVRALTEQEKLWPYPLKVCVVIGLFVFFEYFLDFLTWCFGLGQLAAPELRYQQQEGDVTEDPSLLRTLSVLTLNVWVNNARENAKNQIRSIRELNPDVIFLQEVFHLDVLEAYRVGFPDYHLVTFNRAHNISAVVLVIAGMLCVAAAFSGAVWVVEKATDDTLWRAIWFAAVPIMMVLYHRIVRHHWTIAFLTGNRTGLSLLIRRDAIDVREINCVLYSRAGHAADIMNIFRPRGFISVTAGLKLPGSRCPLPVRFVTTHLNAPLEQAWGDGRHRQVKEIFHRCLRDELLVLGCDLNATPPGTDHGSDCNTYSDVTRELSDAWDVNPNDPNRDGLTWDQQDNPASVSPLNALWWGSRLMRWRCDYIFWRSHIARSSPSLEPISCETEQVDTNSVSVTPPPSREPAATTVLLGGEKQVTEHVRAPSTCNGVDSKVSVQSCSLVFTGGAAVSDHYGVYAVFDIRA